MAALKNSFSRSERIVQALMLHGNYSGNLGLAGGQTGIALYFYLLARSTGCGMYREYAEELLDEVTEKIPRNIPINFTDGVSGIGWAVAFLIGNGFVEADPDDILEVFDERVFHVLTNEEPCPADIAGMEMYLCARLAGRDEDRSPVVGALRRCLSVAAEHLGACATADFLANAAGSVPQGFDLSWYFPWLLYAAGEACKMSAGTTAGKVEASLSSAAVELLGEGNLHPVCFDWLLCVLSRNGHGIPRSFMPVAGEDLPGPFMRNGLAGLLFLARLFAEAGFPQDTGGLWKEKILAWPEYGTPTAGYPAGKEDASVLGLLDGLAGLGLVML